MRFSNHVDRAGERLPRKRIELEIDPLAFRNKLHLRLVDDHRGLKLLRRPHQTENRALHECAAEIFFIEGVARPRGQLARSIRPGHDAIGGQDNPVVGGQQQQLVPILMLLLKLILGAFERFLHC